MIHKLFTHSITMALAFFLTVGVCNAGNIDDLTGQKIIISHDWDESTGTGEINFNDGKATGGGDFGRIRKIKRKGDTLKINLKFNLFGKGRSSLLEWIIGSPIAKLDIYDCNRNCSKTVRVKYVKQ